MNPVTQITARERGKRLNSSCMPATSRWKRLGVASALWKGREKMIKSILLEVAGLLLNQRVPLRGER